MSSGSPIIAAFASARIQQQNSPLNNNTLLDDDTASDPFDPEPLSREGTNDPEPESSATDGRKRKLQQVSTPQARIKVVKWIVEDEINNGKSGLFARVIKEFPGDFRGSPNAMSVIKSLYMDQS